jgi:hypothetical protein
MQLKYQRHSILLSIATLLQQRPAASSGSLCTDRGRHGRPSEA